MAGGAERLLWTRSPKAGMCECPSEDHQVTVLANTGDSKNSVASTSMQFFGNTFSDFD